MPYMDLAKFCQSYELKLEEEFERDGKPAEWAPGQDGPRFWGTEDASITLKDDAPNKDDDDKSQAAAITPDARFLAVATDTIIRIYQVGTRQLQAELIGHLSDVQKLHFGPDRDQDKKQASIDDQRPHGGEQKYVLFSEGDEVSGQSEQIIRWYLDEQGRPLTRTMPFAIEGMADSATNAIKGDLVDHHGLEKEDINSVRNAFVEALKTADTQNRVKNLPVWKGNHFPSFGCQPISHDGKTVFYISHGRTTQHGMRPLDELPQLVVVDIATQEELCRLKGHEDAIMWAGWSPDDNVIATACWDQYFKLWDAKSGTCLNTIGPTGVQNWSGAFAPDGKSVLLSGGDPSPVAIHDIATGDKIVTLEQEGLKLDHWMRYLTWDTSSNEIALINGHSVIIWKPFENEVETVFRLKDDGSMLTRYNTVRSVKWADGGKKLLLQDTGDVAYVWDREKNVKWRFQRPNGTPLNGETDIFYIEEMDTVVCLDGGPEGEVLEVVKDD